MAKMKPKTLAAIGRWGVLLPPTIALAAAGIGKFTDPTRWQAEFRHWGLPESMVPVIGAAEAGAALLMLVTVTRFYGGVLGALVMAGALVTHVIAGEYPNIMVNLLIGGLAGLTAWWARPEFVDNLLAKKTE